MQLCYKIDEPQHRGYHRLGQLILERFFLTYIVIYLLIRYYNPVKIYYTKKDK